MPLPEAPPLGGLHHVTLLAGEPAENVRFHTETLGLRLVKATVNFDDPGVHHTYFGDGRGNPGTLLTHFPFGPIAPAERGVGEPRAITLLVPLATLDGWKERLRAERIETYEAEPYFGARSLRFRDPDGTELRLEEANEEIEVPWPGMPFPSAETPVRVGGVEIAPRNSARSLALLQEVLGFEIVAEEGRVTRLALGDATLDVLRDSPGDAPARPGRGAIHHIAWRTKDDESQRLWLERLRAAGLHPTDVRDRDYFRSIYFREPGGVLFEIATEGPGFERDEPFERLGTGLRLPAAYEAHRREIEAALPPLPFASASKAPSLPTNPDERQ